MSRFDLDRRTVLRGLLAGSAVSVGLPVFDAMLAGNGDALADGSPLPVRFGVWFWGNGVRPDRWTPGETGAGYAPSEELEPLRGVLPWVSVASGCRVKTATHAHHAGMTGVLTGAKYHQLGTVANTIVTTFARPSVDMIAADAFDGEAPFRSIEVGVCEFNGTDEGTTFQHLSHNGPNDPNPAEYDPAALYRRLFGVTPDRAVDLARASVLDAVGEQTRALQRRLGASDQQRLDRHLTSIRALETRLARDPTACAAPSEPVPIPDPDGREPIAERNAAISELLAVALTCNLTRVFSVQFSTCGSDVVVWQAGAADGLHYLCHAEAQPQPTVHAATTFTMEQLAVFLEILRDTPDGDGSLLDHCAILGATEVGDGQTHSIDDMPILVMGKAGGALAGGVHYRSTTDENASSAVLTVLRAAGVEVDGFGVDEGYSDSTLPELEG